jgi:phage-related protein
MRRLAALASTLLLALVAAGCTQAGSSTDSAANFKGQQHDVATTVEDLQSAASKRDEAQVCSQLLDKQLADKLDAMPGGCQAKVKAALKDTDTTDLTVEAVAIDGSTATARVKTENGAKDKTTTLQLVNEGGRWKISSFG